MVTVLTIRWSQPLLWLQVGVGTRGTPGHGLQVMAARGFAWCQ